MGMAKLPEKEVQFKPTWVVDVHVGGGLENFVTSLSNSYIDTTVITSYYWVSMVPYNPVKISLVH